MTLTARGRPPAYHKKVQGKHHHHGKAYRKAYWPYLPLIAIALAGVLLNAAWQAQRSVLGYATDMSAQSLLDDTNTQRADYHETALALNAQLSQAAQTKANDMAKRNYWSHDTPDGRTPWSFITAAGYDYQSAGENLAYGFATAGNTVTGWMNSPEHRANILDAGYQNVGFGIVNIPNYQGSGPETLVVAMYARPASAAVAAASPSPSANATASGAQSASSGGASITTPTSQQQATLAARDTTTPQSRDVSRLGMLTAGRASWTTFALSLIITAAVLFILLRHSFAWHKYLAKGEQALLHHPWLDTAAVFVITAGLVLSHTVGIIQ